MNQNEDIPQSIEVDQEEEARKIQEAHEEQEKKLRAAFVEDHNSRIDDAHAFDWDSWEQETGLERTPIPDKINE